MPRMFFGSVALIASCATLTSTVSAAVLFGTQTSCGLSDIYPNGGITNGSFEFAGRQGTTSSAVLRDPTHADSDGSGPFNRGIARADATLTGNLTNPSLPTLRAEGRLSGGNSGIEYDGEFPVGSVATAQARAIDAFMYIGNAPMTMALTFTVEADVRWEAGHPSLSGVYAYVAVLDDQATDYAVDPWSLGENGAHFLTSGGVEAGTTLEITGDTGGAVAQVSAMVFFDLVPGQIFHVAAGLYAGAVYSIDYTDAFNTAFGNFSDPSLIVSHRVPAPAAPLLLAAAALTATRRRR